MRRLGRLSLWVLVALGISVHTAGAQTILGHLLDAQTDGPVMLRYVALLTEEGERVAWTLSDETGYFRLEAPGPGSFQIYGESLGYRSSVEGPFLLGEDQAVPAEFRIDPMPIVLDSILVVARSRRVSLVLTGYYDREQQGLGHFIGPDKILERFEARRLTDFLWGVPGVRLMPRDNMAGSGYVPMMRSAATLRGYCLPDIYLDGIPQGEASEIDDFIQPWDIEGIEVYRSASEVLARFTSAGAACGVILLWSKKGG
ncbi:TonB-dependent receptor plug domain-containing protein [Gemmatimonadota bacterium]